jgi:pyruvate kinase
MVARGDLGVEIPFVEVPSVQKYLIKKCRLLGKRVITATEMLESMIYNSRPTRAEISDVANAVYDGSSAVMLSGESAMGKYPSKTIKIMSKILEETENRIDYIDRFRDENFKIQNSADAISHSTCCMAIDVNAKAVVVTSISGKTVRMVSRFRVPVDIIGMATNKKVWYKLALSWGVIPEMSETFNSMDVLFYKANKAATERLKLSTGDIIVMTGGSNTGEQGSTNTIRMDTVQ